MRSASDRQKPGVKKYRKVTSYSKGFVINTVLCMTNILVGPTLMHSFWHALRSSDIFCAFRLYIAWVSSLLLCKENEQNEKMK